MFYLWISLALGAIAGLANLFGGAIVSARPWSRPFLAYFIALGSGFMLAMVFADMIPESFHLSPGSAPALILLGYFIVHFFEHAVPKHFHFGEETHADEFLDPSVAYAALGGLLIHTFFDGMAISSGFVISNWLGTIIFTATIMHNIPEGFTMSSIMVTAGKTRGAALAAAGALGISRIAGILAMALAHRWASCGLALSAGVTLYVAASDLIPEVNKMGSVRFTLAVGAGVALVLLLHLIFLH
jgi:zinc and cadmium transporter